MQSNVLKLIIYPLIKLFFVILRLFEVEESNTILDFRQHRFFYAQP